MIVWYLFLTLAACMSLLTAASACFRINLEVIGKFNLFLILMTLFSIVGLRELSVGPDTYAYFKEFQDAKVYLDNRVRPREFGFSYILYFFNSSGFHFQSFLLFCSVVSGIVLFWLVKNYKISNLTFILLLFLLGFISFSLSGLRQYIAIIICLLGYISGKKHLAISFLMFVFASVVHSSSIFFVLVFFAVKWASRQISLGRFLAITFFCGAFVYVFFDFISGSLISMGLYRKEYITEMSFTNFKVVLLHLVLLGVSLLFLFVNHGKVKVFKILTTKGYLKFSEYFIFFTVFLVPLIIFISTEVRLIERIGLYFIPFQSLFISSQFKIFYTKKKNFEFAMAFLIALYFSVVYLIVRDSALATFVLNF